MKPAARAIVLVGIMLAGCETAHNVVVSSYHVVTAPVRFVGRHAGDPWHSTTTTNASDVSNPGQPLPTASPTPQPRVAAGAATSAAPTVTPRASGSQTAQAKPRTSPSPRAASTGSQFPVAKPVPGKPGLVFNPFDPNGGFIDVSGYTPGSKVKDPDSQKIFIVP